MTAAYMAVVDCDCACAPYVYYPLPPFRQSHLSHIVTYCHSAWIQTLAGEQERQDSDGTRRVVLAYTMIQQYRWMVPNQSTFCWIIRNFLV